MRSHRMLLISALGLAALGWVVLSGRTADPHSTSGSTAAAMHAADPRITWQVTVFEHVKRAVVNIHSERTAQAMLPDDLLATMPSQNRISGMGTGIVIDPRGYIVTNHHVVDEVNMIRVKFFDGATTPARIVARDAENDLALIKVDVSQPLPAIPLGTSSDLMVGEEVMAIGNAYGYSHTMSSGHISQLNRDVSLNKEISYKSLIQTDAPINPGNSGGPLLNVKGELIGVNVAIRAGAQNIGFAIPVDSMIRAAAAMMASRRRSPITLGLTCRDKLETEGDLDPKFVKAHSEVLCWAPVVRRTLIVDHVEPNSPAAKAGIQVGDTLVSAGDVKLICSLDLERALVDRTPGDKLPLVVRRKKDEQQIDIALAAGERSGPVPADVTWKKLGVRLSAADPEIVARANSQLHGGLNVLEVRPDSAAARAGIQKGDVIVGLHQWEMLSIENVAFVLTHPDLATFNPLRFYILRGGQVHRGWIQQLE